MNDSFNITISKEGLRTIMRALECYSRLGINQFGYCLEHNPAFAKLDYEERDGIEKYLRSKIDARNFGIYHPEVAEFTEAFQINKEIEKYVALSEVGWVAESYSKSYDGALDENAPNIPKFRDSNGNSLLWERVFEIPLRLRKKMMNLSKSKKYTEIWDLVNKNIDFGGIKGNSTRISDDFTKIIISKPYKISEK